MVTDTKNISNAPEPIHVLPGYEYVPYQLSNGEHLNHTDFIVLAEQEILRTFDASNTSDLRTRLNISLIEDRDSKNKTYIAGCKSNPDIICEGANDYILVEAKSTPSEADAPRFKDQIRDYLMFLATIDSKRLKLIISVPYCAISLAERTIERAWETIVGLATTNPDTHAPADLGAAKAMSRRADIEIRVISEITQKDIPAPRGYNHMYEVYGTNEEEHPTTITVDNETHIVSEVFWPVDKLRFDEENIRFCRTDITTYKDNQDACWKALLNDAGDITASNRYHEKNAVQRRREIITAGTIKNAAYAYVENDVDKPLLVDGNSRVAHARYICQEAHSAKGYERVLVILFKKSDGFTYEKITRAKIEKQHETTLEHGIIQDAISMWRMENIEKKSREDIYDIYQSIYENSRIVDQSIETITLLRKNNVDDEGIAALYNACWYLTPSSKFRDTMLTDAGKRKGITMEAIIGRLKAEQGSIKRNGKDTNGTYLAGPQFKKSIKTALKNANRPAELTELLAQWVKGDAANTPDEFVAEMNRINAEAAKRRKESYGQRIIQSLKMIQGTLESIQMKCDAINAMQNMPEDASTNVPKLTKSERKTIEALLQSLREKDALMRLSIHDCYD